MRVPSQGEVHVDGATDALIRANGEQDSARRKEWHEVALVWAVLALRDAVQQADATMKEVANRQIDSMQDLDRTLQTATNATISELRRATIRKVA